MIQPAVAVDVQHGFRASAALVPLIALQVTAFGYRVREADCRKIADLSRSRYGTLCAARCRMKTGLLQVRGVVVARVRMFAHHRPR